ncbi:hypothetical protein K2X33_02005 [bacterium]|nr:hypothetical protein [bacterium]
MKMDIFKRSRSLGLSFLHPLVVLVLIVSLLGATPAQSAPSGQNPTSLELTKKADQAMNASMINAIFAAFGATPLMASLLAVREIQALSPEGRIGCAAVVAAFSIFSIVSTIQLGVSTTRLIHTMPKIYPTLLKERLNLFIEQARRTLIEIGEKYPVTQLEEKTKALTGPEETVTQFLALIHWFNETTEGQECFALLSSRTPKLGNEILSLLEQGVEMGTSWKETLEEPAAARGPELSIESEKLLRTTQPTN